MSSLDERPFPRAALMGAAGLVLFTVLGVGLHQHLKFSAGTQATAITDVSPVIASRPLKFVDEGGGATAFGGHVSVFDPATGAHIADLVPSDGFIRAVLGGLNYERVKQHVQADTVFTLTARANGRMTLDDPLTGTAINLGAFGAANRAVFLKFLPTSGQVS
jgi:putative photosynthetic complex assembly protein